MEDDDLARWEDGLDEIRRSPRGAGRIELIACRPAVDERVILDEATFDAEHGLVGDTWSRRPSTSSVDGGPHPDAQVTMANARLMALIAGPPDRWALAGDQLYVDLDLSAEHLPPGTRLALGSAVLEVSAKPHTGCAKFAQRFGQDAMRLVNSPEGRALRLRGVNTRVVVPGTVRRGDAITLVE